MLKRILAITGKPGLYEIVSQGNKMLLLEDLQTKKRIPVYSRDKIVSLGDIAIYTEEEDAPLGEILDKLFSGMNGEHIDVKKLIAEKSLRKSFEEIIPEHDRERVYESDIKKLYNWYNILIDAGFKKFTEDKDNTENPSEE